jgi:hypothetical protein
MKYKGHGRIIAFCIKLLSQHSYGWIEEKHESCVRKTGLRFETLNLYVEYEAEF